MRAILVTAIVGFGLGATAAWLRSPRTERVVAPPRDPDVAEIAGRVAIEDGVGGWIETASGSLTVGVELRGEEWMAARDVRTVDVAQGRFRLLVPRGAAVCVEEGMIDGREIDFGDRPRLVTESTSLVLRGETIDMLLHFVGAGTGVGVRGVKLAAPGWSGDVMRPSRESEERAVEGELGSIVRIPSDEIWPGNSWFARGDGYGWRRFEIDTTDRRKQVVELHREATLEVKARGLPESLPTVLRLRSPDLSTVLWEEPLDPASPRVVVDGLVTAEVVVSVEIGRADHPRNLVLAERGAFLRSGRRATTRLNCGEVAAVSEPVKWTGTLVVPDEWGVDVVPLTLEMVNRPVDCAWTTRSVEPDAWPPYGDEFPWDAGLALPGSYVAIVDLGGPGPKWTVPVEVPGGDRTEPVSGTGEVVGWEYGTRITFFVDTAGEYDVTIDPGPEYRTPGTQRVTVAEGEITDLEIALRVR